MIHEFYVQMEGLDKIQHDFGILKDQSKKVLKAALNNAAKDLTKQMTHGANKRYKLKEGLKGYKSANKTKKATVGNLEAVITARGNVLDMHDYKMSDTTVYPGGKGAPKWVKAKVLRKSRLKSISRFTHGRDKYKGFMVRFHNGHEAFVSRRPGSVSKSNPNKEVIETLYSPAVSKGEEVVYRDDLEGDVHALLLKNIEQQIHRFLG